MQFDKKTQVRIIVFTIITINLLGLFVYMYRKSTYLSRHCGDIDYIYNDIGKVANY